MNDDEILKINEHVAQQINDLIAGKRDFRLSRAALKRMVNTSMWDLIGKVYDFEPKWTEFHGIRCFDWSSCSAKFWEAFQPESWSPEAQAKKAEAKKKKAEIRKLVAEAKARRLMFPPADNVTANKPVVDWAKHGVNAAPANATVRKNSNTAKPDGLSHKDWQKWQRRNTCKGNRWTTWKKQNGICYYCKHPIIYEEWTIDHRIPVSRGGSNSFPNKVGSCLHCNEEKANMTEQEYLSVHPDKRMEFIQSLHKLCKSHEPKAIRSGQSQIISLADAANELQQSRSDQKSVGPDGLESKAN